VATRATISVAPTANVLGLGRTTAYEAARRSEFPTRRFGPRVVVPAPALLDWLGSRIVPGMSADGAERVAGLADWSANGTLSGGSEDAQAPERARGDRAAQ
jgi:hypothetical protein